MLASTCLPLLMQAVEIDGALLLGWQFTGNPAIFPLMYECDCSGHNDGAHHAGRASWHSDNIAAIMNRMQEISFNVSLIREMRTIAYLNRAG